uniref:Uncharacterized protein n=1 Tax=Mycena chlorophos TaxID=658473 RepID=A0ABQ0MDK1_MYCCL|nr:predicted protein [Mycena chlorophos]
MPSRAPRLPSEQTLSEESTNTDADAGKAERGSLLAPYSTDEGDVVHSTFLRRSPSIMYSTLFYIALALYAWVVTCILSHRPIGANHYGVDVLNADNNGYGWVGAIYYHALYVKSERYFKAARVIQSIVSVLTIPVASAVVTRAAVVFLQSAGRRRNISLRKAMALSDRSWTDVSVIAGLFFGGWKQYGSSLLLVAILLNGLGAAISPVQELFLTTKTIKTPTWPEMMPELVDIPDHFSAIVGSLDDGAVTTLTRARMTSTTNSQPQANLWSQPIDCSGLSDTTNLDCVFAGGQYILGNMSLLTDPFYCQLPSGYNTGLIKQFAPRINSTAHRENITAAEFPSNCASIPNALYLRYANGSDEGSYALEACMPGDMTVSPWKSQRERQDFGEVLYLNITLKGFEGLPVGQNGSYYSRIVVNTTAGYFELPNYMNGGTNGPLITDDPSNYCDLSCAIQGSFSNPIYDHNVTRRTVNTGLPGDTTQELIRNVNKGPLQVVALALFGLGSFIDKATSYKAYFAAAPNRNATGLCMENVPFIPLVRDEFDNVGVYQGLDPCLSYSLDPADVATDVAYYLWSMVWSSYDGYAGTTIENAFTSAAFLANEAWMTSVGDGSFTVSYDPGADTQVPVISQTAILGISVLLGVYLTSLLALALYGAWWPHWTQRLDAFAMLRIGAALSDKLPLVVVKSQSKFTVLDELPGWIGDGSGGTGNVGELEVGADAPLLRNRRYRCIAVDHDHRKDE